MNREEIVELIKVIEKFEKVAEQRAEKLYQAKNPWEKYPADFHCVSWYNSNEKTICISYEDYDGYCRQYYPIEFFTDDFDVDAHLKQQLDEFAITQKKNLEAKKLKEEKAEREQYEMLKKKFEGESK